MKNFTIITAGGIGKRMGKNLPKQFIELHGKPILMHTIEKFHDFDNSMNLILSLPKEHISFWQELCRKHNFSIQHKIVEGGETRFHSIKNSLEFVPENCLVAIHDGVRPLINSKIIENAFEMAKNNSNAVVANKIIFSIRKVDENGSKALNREDFREIQTPQIFHSSDIKRAYNQPFSDLFTDDASVAEKMGLKINLIEGNSENIKITNPIDLIIAEAILDC